MKINSDFKIFNFTILFTKISFTFFLSILVPPLVHAENIANLQKNASIAYEEMMKTKQSADTLTKDAVFAEKKLASIKQKLAAAEQEAKAARKNRSRLRFQWSKQSVGGNKLPMRWLMNGIKLKENNQKVRTMLQRSF